MYVNGVPTRAKRALSYRSRFDIKYFREFPNGVDIRVLFLRTQVVLKVSKFFSVSLSMFFLSPQGPEPRRIVPLLGLLIVPVHEDLLTRMLHSQIYPANFVPSPCHRFIKLIEDKGKVSYFLQLGLSRLLTLSQQLLRVNRLCVLLVSG